MKTLKESRAEFLVKREWKDEAFTATLLFLTAVSLRRSEGLLTMFFFYQSRKNFPSINVDNNFYRGVDKEDNNIISSQKKIISDTRFKIIYGLGASK